VLEINTIFPKNGIFAFSKLSERLWFTILCNFYTIYIGRDSSLNFPGEPSIEIGISQQEGLSPRIASFPCTNKKVPVPHNRGLHKEGVDQQITHKPNQN